MVGFGCISKQQQATKWTQNNNKSKIYKLTLFSVYPLDLYLAESLARDALNEQFWMLSDCWVESTVFIFQ